MATLPFQLDPSILRRITPGFGDAFGQPPVLKQPATLDGGPLRIVAPPSDPAAAPALVRPPAVGPNAINLPRLTAPDLSSDAAPSLPPITLPKVSLSPSAPQARLATDTAELTRLRNSGSGIDQITKPVDDQGNPTGQPVGIGRHILGGLARIGDIGLSLVAPGAAMMIPGTTLHNKLLQKQEVGRIGEDQGELQKNAVLADTQAQGQQRQALAQQEQAKADALLNPRPSNGQLLYDKNGTPIGFQDGEGNYFGPSDPKLPQGVRDVLGSAQRKQPTNAFELWQSQNPKGTAEDYMRLEADGKNKPLDQQLIEAEASGDVQKASTIRNVIRETKVQPRIDVHTATAAPAGGGITLPSSGQINPTVQAILEGRVPAPSVRSKQGMALMQAVTAADPTYDASRYNTYQAMQKEMTSGKTGANINALNTLLNHIQDARQHLPDNGNVGVFNAVGNTLGTATGKNPTGKFDTDAVGIGGEFGKLVSGGVATVDEQKHLQSLLDHNASPKTLKDNLDEIENLARGKLAGIQTQVQSSYHPGAGSNAPNSIPTMGTPNLSFAPQTHTFSVSAWQRANPRGDVNAAKTAAQSQNFQVVP